MNILDKAFIGKHFAATYADPDGLLLAYEEGIAKQVFVKLWDLYPMYDWAVKVDARPSVGMVSVKLPTLMGATMGYNFPLDKLAADPEMLIVRKAGGEILERWNLRRGKANTVAFHEAKRVWRVASNIVNKVSAQAGLATTPRPALLAA